MTPAQRDLLAYLATVRVARVTGNQLPVARRLEALGFAEVGVGGSGVAFVAPWWWEAQITDAGRANLAEERARRVLAEAEIDPDALLPDPDVVEREGVGDPGDVETEGWT